eukprot:5113474-Prymnesium_polylepis.1
MPRLSCELCAPPRRSSALEDAYPKKYRFATSAFPGEGAAGPAPAARGSGSVPPPPASNAIAAA